MVLFFLLCFLCVDQNLISQLLAPFSQHAFLSIVMPCPSPLFQGGLHTGKEPAREMCATDSKAGGQNLLCSLELKVQLPDMGLQIC